MGALLRSIRARFTAFFEADRAALEQMIDCTHVEIGACDACKADWILLSAS